MLLRLRCVDLLLDLWLRRLDLLLNLRRKDLDLRLRLELHLRLRLLLEDRRRRQLSLDLWLHRCLNRRLGVHGLESLLFQVIRDETVKSALANFDGLLLCLL